MTTAKAAPLKYVWFRLESVPLHTESPRWAAHAPEQVAAACNRGADIIGLTETRGPVMAECKRIAKAHGYTWYGHAVDRHRNVALLVKHGLHVLHHDAVVVFNNYRVEVTIDFHGSKVTVFQMHWEPSDAGHAEQSASLIKAMKKESAGSRLSFYMGDSNPDKPQPVHGSQPNATMTQAGMPVIYEELDHYPVGIGVNVIGRNLKDTRVKAVSVGTHAALGSDHVPVTGVYKIRLARAS